MYVSNGIYELIGVFRKIRSLAMLLIQTRCSSMSVIVLVCSPLEILRAVVQFYAVFMVDSLIREYINRWLKECLRDKTMNGIFILAYGHNPIPCWPNGSIEDSGLQHSLSTIAVN